MAQVFIEEKIFDKIDFNQNPLSKGEYEYCTFINCDLSYADPKLNRIKKAKFSRSGIAGLLDKYDIEIDLAN
jgi:hypothetical protein